MEESTLPREARLLKGTQFRRVFEARQVVSNRFFRIHQAPQPDVDASAAGSARIGLAIAKRVARRAVDRNRIRRQARETFRLHRHHLPPADFVVLAKPGAAAADTQDLRRALNQLWNRFEMR